MKLSPYLRLMRLHQPVGIWLLLWPCWWSIALASPGLPSLRLLLLFVLGALLMRSAGCIINDIADREFDRQVERTKSRPLASGELSVAHALGLLAVLLAAALGVAFVLGAAVVLWSALALPLVAAYPWMKRLTWWPQLFLGITFNWGAPLGWIAVRGTLGWPAVCLYAGCIFWTLGYDTIYALQDKADDRRVGVKSSALRLGGNVKRAIGLFYLLAMLGWIAAGLAAEEHALLLALLALGQLHFGWQLCQLDSDRPTSCRRIFLSNIWLGLLIFLAFIAGKW